MNAWPAAWVYSDLIRTTKSLHGSHIVAWKRWKTCQLPEQDMLSLIPLFFFSGVTLAHRAAATCLLHRAARGGRGESAEASSQPTGYIIIVLSPTVASRERIMGETTHRARRLAWQTGSD